MKLRMIITTVIAIAISSMCFGQAESTIESLSKRYQSCLDKGENMLGCSQGYYKEMDSLLNVVYNHIRVTCDSIEKENLKDEQLAWLKERDDYFKETYSEFKKGNDNISPNGDANGAKDDAMIMHDSNAEYVKKRVLLLLTKTKSNYSFGNYFVEPTGYYEIGKNEADKDGEIYGMFGTVKVKKIDNSRISIHLFACKGAPSYNSGTAIDTIEIKDNIAIYTTEDDPTCRIILTFSNLGVMVEQFDEDPNFACGFGHAVDAYGFYKRTSYSTPTDKELLDEN
jgi:uncharacterized protein YecT (DUF1311 family)